MADLNLKKRWDNLKEFYYNKGYMQALTDISDNIIMHSKAKMKDTEKIVDYLKKAAEEDTNT